MIKTPDDRRPPLTPQLALRVAILGSFALALFAIIFFRLWFLQVLNGQAYVKQAQVNQVRQISTPSPRGEIFDHNGNVLVDNTKELDVTLSPASLPVKLNQLNIGNTPKSDRAVYRRLARVVGISTAPAPCKMNAHILGRYYGTLHVSQIECAVDQQLVTTPYANVRIQRNVSTDVQYYILERQQQFPGVQVQEVYVRRYPLGSLAGQLFGTIGPISSAELKDPRFKGISEQDYVGQAGLEWYYNHYLQGTDGQERFQVNALGDFNGYLPGSSPRAGNALKLSLDTNLQRVGQQALQQSMDSNAAPAGAFVAMNPDNGQIYAMGSLPTFDPNIFTKPISQQAYQQLNNASSGYPLFNRAIQSVGPTGSTFKGITAVAALQSGVWSVGETYDDTGSFCEGGGLCRRNAGGAAYGVLDITQAIQVSSDVFFYNLGAQLNSNAPAGGALQQWARKLGIGQQSGVDLGGEYAGNLPRPAWRTHIDQLETACEHKKHVPSCGIADGRPWSEGDNVNLAVGQGDVQVTPLQLAVAYSAIANGGTVVRPHVGEAIESGDGTVLQKIDPPPVRHLSISPGNLDAIRQGLHEAAQSPGGTSYDVMGNFPQQVYGKTGTAQYNGQNDYAWYVCFVPDWATNKPILVVAHVEQGGFGAIAAAPVAREILSQWFYGNKGQYVAGSSRTL
jgi:penicillin-binding protein 2